MSWKRDNSYWVTNFFQKIPWFTRTLHECRVFLNRIRSHSMVIPEISVTLQDCITSVRLSIIQLCYVEVQSWWQRQDSCTIARLCCTRLHRNRTNSLNSLNQVANHSTIAIATNRCPLIRHVKLPNISSKHYRRNCMN